MAKHSFAKAAVILFVITGASKVAAFFGTVIFSHYFGADVVTDAYYAAGTVPNLVNNSLTVCALTQFIPIYSRCTAEDGGERASKFASNVLNVFVTFNLFLVATVGFVSPFLARLVAPGFSGDGIAHTEHMVVLLSLSFPFTIAAQVLTNLFNAKQRFVFPAILTLLNHVLAMVITVFLAPRFGLYCYPIICTTVWVIQAFILYVAARGRLFSHSIKIDFHDDYLVLMLVQSIPVVIATASDQINLAADNIISSSLPSGSLSALGYAHRIFNSVNGFVSVVLLTIYYPVISRQYAEKDRAGVDSSVKKCVDLLALLTMPMMAVLILNSSDIVNLLLHHGAMSSEDAGRIGQLFSIYCAGLLFLSIRELLTKLFYVIGDTVRPTVVNVVCVMLNIALSLVLKEYMGVVGVALATTVTTVILTIVEAMVLVYRVGGQDALMRHDVMDTMGLLRIILTCLLSASAMGLVRAFLADANGIARLVTGVLVFVALYVILGILFGNEYLVGFFNGISKRLMVKSTAESTEE